MSEIESTDLICEARRRTLTERDERRLEELMLTNLDARLMQLMQPELERVSRVQRGDDALAARIADRAMELANRGSPRRLRGPVWLLAASILMCATGAGAWWVAHPLAPVDDAAPGATDAHASGLRRAGKAATTTSPAAAMDSVDRAPSTPRDDAAEGGHSADRTMVKQNATGKCRDCPRAEGSSTPSAAQLFARANLLRRAGQGTEALQLYRTIIKEHGRSREASLARLGLAKSVSGSNPKQALAYYQELAQSGGSLRAEALWGVVESATALQQTAVRQQALSDLMREFPASPYAEVARQGLIDAAR